MPEVSVIIPVYNPGDYLKMAVESVIAQTYKDWEIVLIDDGSPQDVSDVVEMHPAIRLLRQSNQGQSIARNLGILNSSSAYIAFLDQDDLWWPTKLEKQMAFFAEHPDVDLCHTAFDVINSDGEFIEMGFAQPIESYEELLGGCQMMNCAVVLKRECFADSGLLRSEYRGVQDYDLWLRVARHHKMGFIPSCEASWRVHDNNFSRNMDVMYQENIRLMREHLALAKAAGNHAAEAVIGKTMKAFRVSFGCNAFEVSRESFRKRDWSSFLAQYRRALSLYPGFVMISTLTYVLGKRERQSLTPTKLKEN